MREDVRDSETGSMVRSNTVVANVGPHEENSGS